MLVGSKILRETQTYKLQKIFDSWVNEKIVEKTREEINEKIRLVPKFGGNTTLESVSFVGQWVVGGWWVGGVLFFVLTSVQSCPYPRATRGKPSLRSELQNIKIEIINYTERHKFFIVVCGFQCGHVLRTPPKPGFTFSHPFAYYESLLKKNSKKGIGDMHISIHSQSGQCTTVYYSVNYHQFWT